VSVAPAALAALAGAAAPAAGNSADPPEQAYKQPQL
jgi:hypothetical protein